MLGKLVRGMAKSQFQRSFRLSRTFSMPKGHNGLDPESTSFLSQTLGANRLQDRISDIEQEAPDLENLSLFSMDSLSQLPPWFKFLEPLVSGGKVNVAHQDYLEHLMLLTDFPLWGIALGVCLAVRTSILPLIFFQMKKITKFTVVGSK